MQEPSTSSAELQLVVFKVAGEEFAVEIGQVREIVRLVPITLVPRASAFIEGVVNLRGQILAVIDLSKRLKLKATPRTDNSRIVVVEIEGNTAGMIVDEVTEVLRLAVANVEKTPELISTEVQHHYLKGVGKLGERLLILIDLGKVLSPEEIEDIKKTQEVQGKEEKDEREEKI